MDAPQRFKLIDGIFSPAEAKDILLSLVKSKIDHHSLRLVSDSERFGDDVSHSEKRISELKQLQVSLKDLLVASADTNQELAIEGWIEITPASHCPGEHY